MFEELLWEKGTIIYGRVSTDMMFSFIGKEEHATCGIFTGNGRGSTGNDDVTIPNLECF